MEGGFLLGKTMETIKKVSIAHILRDSYPSAYLRRFAGGKSEAVAAETTDCRP